MIFESVLISFFCSLVRSCKPTETLFQRSKSSRSTIQSCLLGKQQVRKPTVHNKSCPIEHMIYYRVAPYIGNMTDKGKAVMLSLAHWCGTVVRSKPPSRKFQKCTMGGCPNYLYNALNGRNANDQALSRALRSLERCSRSQRPSWVGNRLAKERRFLDS